jgi:hypothetical protein
MFPAITLTVERYNALTADELAQLHAHLKHLPNVLAKATALDAPAQKPETTDDIIITCAVCADDSYWQQNFGPLWQAAQWWYCGPFGLGCPPSGG